jgi:hypothetical protein
MIFDERSISLATPSPSPCRSTSSSHSGRDFGQSGAF